MIVLEKEPELNSSHRNFQLYGKRKIQLQSVP
jgi:hypothetical protein